MTLIFWSEHMRKWKKLSIGSKVLFIVMIVLIYIYSRLFIENGKLDFNDRIFFVGVLVVFTFIGVVSSLNLTTQNGKKITLGSVIGAIVIYILFLMYRAVLEFWV